MTGPVFCGECKYHRYNEEGSDHCRSKPESGQNWLHKYADCWECREKNASNDCPDFEPLWWVRFEVWLGTRKNEG